MRDYKKKMNKYRLSKEKYKELREFCLCSDMDERILIEMAIANTFDSNSDALGNFIYLHVVSTDYTWARLEASGIPCNRDTFYIYRAKFYYELNKILFNYSAEERE